MAARDDWPKMPNGMDFDGRHLLVFVREGKSPFHNQWDVNLLLQEIEKNLDVQVDDIPYVYQGSNCYSCLLEKAAHIRASLYKYEVSSEFASTWLRERLFEQKPETFPIPVAPTRDDNNTVGPIAAAARRSLLRLIPHITPKGDDENVLYRFVLEHGDFGIHNMSIAMDLNQQPFITSVYDWETGCIALFSNAPDFKRSIKAGRDLRHLWFALRDWRGDDPEKYFGDLGAWAEQRMRELGVIQTASTLNED
ncbi:hypothetical protein TRIATDRAFT_265731 [Trichoderma atroviride IMI 206040]|uniref:Uncharacterized protein n=1 Tax=Hypocrea atroviridis (strain ATCC 20476 / IMI 206040) TaxID=452589 RepID=G9P086_HYPAI|nr:uncharacterized protein TRIATDRAFT_265731 [Trichoderma atroviride IMI 206040]EHK44130.1 hypothetical protein TRIATDRAFT_265731 [Trichoderma atroviride IMI 206040]